MKVKFTDLENGTYAALEMSWADICDNGLYACFSRNNINQPVLLKKGAFFNYVTNYILTDFQDKYKVFANVNQRQPQYNLIGDSETFIVVYAMIPQQELTSVKDRMDQVSKEAPVGLQKDNVWTPTHETTVGKRGSAKKKEASLAASIVTAGTSIPQEELLGELEVKFPSVNWREHNGRIAIIEDGSGSNGVASDGKPLWTYYPPGDDYTDYPDASTHRELFDYLESRGWYIENQTDTLAYLFPIYSNASGKEAQLSDAVKVAGNYSDIVRKLSEWHGGQGSAVYALMSQLYNGYHVSPMGIEAAISELEGDLNRPEGTYDNEQWSELSGLISDLEVMLEGTISKESETINYSDFQGIPTEKKSLSAEAMKWAWGTQEEDSYDSIKTASTGDAEDLELYVENTANLYEAYTLPNLKYIKKKIDSGTYDASLAPKLWMNLVNAGARQYANEEAKRGGKIFFPISTRMQVAESLAETYFNAVTNGEFSGYFERENAKNKPADDIQASVTEALAKLAGHHF
jgi:hypothetical protein